MRQTLPAIALFGAGLCAGGAVMADEVDYSLRSLVSEPAFEQQVLPVDRQAETATEISFRLSPGRDAMASGAYRGKSPLSLDASSRRIADDELYELPRPDTGFSYRASLRMADEQGDSLSTLNGHSMGLSYGAYRSDWYHGVDFNVAGLAQQQSQGADSQWSLGYTAGRRFSAPMLGGTPMWLLSLRGDFDDGVSQDLEARNEYGDWFLTPSLFWERPDFTLSAGVELPVTPLESTTDDTDYRIRATFQHRF